MNLNWSENGFATSRRINYFLMRTVITSLGEQWRLIQPTEKNKTQGAFRLKDVISMHTKQFVDENTIIIKTSKPSPVRPQAKRVECEKGGSEREGRESAPAPPPTTLLGRDPQAAWPLCRGARVGIDGEERRLLFRRVAPPLEGLQHP